ncbi:MAG TPA: beta-phosphoglucomutase [Anaerolineales bacterium]|jgi:beta-phosphoglucomutase
MALKAVIFDMDGVLTATVEYHYLSWKKVSNEFGLPFTWNDNEKLRGLTRKESLEVLLAGRSIPEEQKDEMLKMKNAYFLESLNNIGPGDILSGVPELLQELRQAGMRIGVASSSRNVRPVLNHLGIAGFIDAMGDGTSVSRPKPEPDIFFYTASSLRVKPRQCLVVEDSEAGVKAGLAAGMCVVGVGPVARLRAAHALFPDLGNVKLIDLLEVYHSWRLEHTLFFPLSRAKTPVWR